MPLSGSRHRHPTVTSTATAQLSLRHLRRGRSRSLPAPRSPWPYSPGPRRGRTNVQNRARKPSSDPSRAASLTPPSTPRGLCPREPDGGHSPPLTATQRHARGDHAAREQKTPADAPRRLARPHPRAPQRVSPTHRAPATLRPLHASPPLKLARHLLPRSPFSFSSQGTPREAFVTPALRGQAASQQTSLKSKEGPWTSLAQSHFFAWSPKGRRVRANEAAAWGQTFLVRSKALGSKGAGGTESAISPGARSPCRRPHPHRMKTMPPPRSERGRLPPPEGGRAHGTQGSWG